MGQTFPLTSLRESSWHSFVLIHSFRCVWKGTAGCVGTSYWWPASRRSPSLLGVTALRLHVKPQVCLCCITLHDVTQERHAIVADTFWTRAPDAGSERECSHRREKMKFSNFQTPVSMNKGRRCRVSRYEILSFLSSPKKIHITPATGVHPIIYFTGGFSSLPTKDALPDIDSNLLTCANTCGAVRRSGQHLWNPASSRVNGPNIWIKPLPEPIYWGMRLTFFGLNKKKKIQ